MKFDHADCVHLGDGRSDPCLIYVRGACAGALCSSSITIEHKLKMQTVIIPVRLKVFYSRREAFRSIRPARRLPFRLRAWAVHVRAETKRL
ncbi:hypothetical protein EVAR_69785_1 [Eumeta japonica]|uniref:Uncharacterized protein n=1 Tax=Eumeta variegata TaxID=151549 RepID=A0A4C2A149_EUMVA|nr:hypothetical protein EVAR_69785_1 [Eumeta japonica]